MGRNLRRFADRAALTLSAVFFAVPIFGSDLASQSVGTLSGTVTAADNLPLAQARIRVLGTDLVTTTRMDGAFDVANVPAGKRELQALLVGYTCLLYTSDAADDLLCVDLGGRRIIKKKKK